MDSDSSRQLDNPRPERLRTIASEAHFTGGNFSLHKFVLDNPEPSHSGDEGFVNAMLQTMSDVPANVANALNGDGYSPLHLAVLKNNLVMVKKLLSCLVNIDVNARCDRVDGNNFFISDHCVKKYAALHIAAEMGRLSIVLELLNGGAAVDIANGDHETPLYVAVKSKHLDVMELLVDRGADVNFKGKWRSPLSNAAVSRNFESVRFLVSRGADVNTPVFENETPLHYAAASGSLEIAEFLISNGADVNAMNEEKETPLHYAVREGHSEILKLLIAKGADWHVTYEHGKTLLHRAARGKNLETVEFLLNLGADVDAVDEIGTTPLHEAVSSSRSNLETVQLLVSKGADWRSYTDRRGETLLHYAVRGRSEVVAFLVDLGADVNAVDDDGRTPLREAVGFGSCLEIVELLVNRGADLKAVDKDGRTLLHHVEKGEYAACLLDRGADLHATDINGWTPLHVAGCEGFRPDVIRVLIDRGADVEAKNKDGDTPLRLARKKKVLFSNIHALTLSKTN